MKFSLETAIEIWSTVEALYKTSELIVSGGGTLWCQYG